MANSYTVYNATAGQQTFTVPFPYLEQSDVQVFINGIQQLTPKDYVWTTGGAIQLYGALIADATVLLQRQTSPNHVLVTFANSATLTAEELNEAVLQNFYLNQELADQLNQYLTSGLAAYSVTGATAGMSPEELLNQIAAGVLNTELANELQQSIDDISNNAQGVLENTNDINTINGIINSLTSEAGFETLLTAEQTSRIAGDSALQTQLNLIGAMNGANNAFILNQSTCYVDNLTSLASYITGVESNFVAAGNAMTAAVASEASTRASADSVNATAISNLQAAVTTQNGTFSSQIGTLQTTVTTLTNAGYQTSAQVTTAIQSQVPGIVATSLTNYSTTTDMNAAIATSSSGLQAQINGNSSAISTNSSAIATINGNLTTLSAQYLLRTDVNGNVVGFGVYNDGTIQGSQIIFNSPNFAIINGSSKVVPFTVTGGQVYMQSVVIQDAVIANMNINKLTQGSLNADMNLGTGHIIFDNGSWEMVIGNQFGSSSNLVMWFGPHQSSLSGCSTSNAKFYLTNTGDAYFGGTLAAGILTNSTSSSVLGTSAVATLNGFGSNGGNITITCSGNFNYHNASGVSGVTITGQLALQQSTNSGSTWTTVSTGPNWSSTGASGDVTVSANGSFTYVDSADTTTTRYYRVIVNSQTGASPTAQTISITTVEQ